MSDYDACAEDDERVRRRVEALETARGQGTTPWSPAYIPYYSVFEAEIVTN